MAGSSRNSVKVVIINTQYVETDAMGFKSVVQNLTGKDAIVQAKPPPMVVVNDNSSRQMTDGNVHMGGNGSHVVVTRGASFKDLDNFLMDIASFDELYQLCME